MWGVLCTLVLSHWHVDCECVCSVGMTRAGVLLTVVELHVRHLSLICRCEFVVTTRGWPCLQFRSGACSNCVTIGYRFCYDDRRDDGDDDDDDDERWWEQL